MTPERLREIARRHAEDLRPAPATWTREQEAAVCSRMYTDRGDLLDLLRRVAKAGYYVEQAAVGDCFYCGCSLVYDNPHRPDCPAPALEALRKED